MIDEINKILAELAEQEREDQIQREYEELVLNPLLQQQYEMSDYDDEQ